MLQLRSPAIYTQTSSLIRATEEKTRTFWPRINFAHVVRHGRSREQSTKRMSSKVWKVYSIDKVIVLVCAFQALSGWAGKVRSHGLAGHTTALVNSGFDWGTYVPNPWLIFTKRQSKLTTNPTLLKCLTLLVGRFSVSLSFISIPQCLVHSYCFRWCSIDHPCPTVV